jgi:catecholate siderophore receptor
MQLIRKKTPMPASRRLVLLACQSSAAIAALGLGSPAIAEHSDAPAIIVYGRPEGYDIEKTRTATKTETPLVDVPQTIAVISREQLDDQALEQLGDALRYVPGVVLGQGEGHRDQVTLRGQNTTADFFLDGLRDDAQYYRPLYNIDRIEVLKGANALIFGRGGGGGVINRVSKTPEFGRSRMAGSISGDSFGAWSVAADLDQPLSDQAAVRINATYEDLRNHRQVFGGHFTGVTPSVGLRFGDASSLVLSYEFAEDERITDRGIPSLAGRPLQGYYDTFFGNPAINRSKVTAHIARARFDHEFGEHLSADLTAQFADYDKYYANIYPRGASATTVQLEGYENSTKRKNWAVQGNLVWNGETGPLRHQLLAGFEASEQNTDDNRRLASFGGAATATIPLSLRIVAPASTFGGLSRLSRSDVRALSAYLQDQVDIGEHLKLVVGLRYDDFRIASTNRINGFTASRSDGKWSPRAGVIVKPRENLSLYASYALSFLPQSGDQFTVLDATTSTLAPEEFRNLEAGVKWDITERIAFTAAAYQLDRRNSRANDPLSGAVVLTGKSRTKGFETALVGQIGQSLQLTVGYAYQDGQIRSATTAAPVGRRLAQLPRHQFSAWTRYDVTDSIGFGLGMVHQSEQFATISNAVRLPAFTRFDAAAFFKVSDQLTVQFNVENLTDRRYFPSAHTDFNITTGEPLSARMSARLKF